MLLTTQSSSGRISRHLNGAQPVRFPGIRPIPSLRICNNTRPSTHPRPTVRIYQRKIPNLRNTFLSCPLKATAIPAEEKKNANLTTRLLIGRGHFLNFIWNAIQNLVWGDGPLKFETPLKESKMPVEIKKEKFNIPSIFFQFNGRILEINGLGPQPIFLIWF